MSNRDKMNDFLTNRWSATSAPAAGTTCVAEISSREPQKRPHLETLIYTVHNRMGAGAAAQTCTVNVRLGSIAGTVVASFDQLTAPSSTANVVMANIGIQGERGVGLSVSMTTVVASVTQKINIAGWWED